VQVGFAVDGNLSSEHENAFAGMEGPRKQGIVASIRQKSNESDFLRDIKGQLADPDSEDLATKALQTEAKLRETKDQLVATAGSSEQEALEQRLKALLEEHEQLKGKLAQSVVIYLYSLDHRPLLEDALTTSRSRLLILSPWIRGEVVDAAFLQKLEALLTKGVNVYMGYGINETPTAKSNAQDQVAKDSLLKLSQRFPHFRLARLGNTHAKVLIKDSDYAVVGSFNWLSFRGDPNRKFRDEQSIKIQRADLVDSKFAELAGRFS
jgi:phosphatidylserine/phosphatidylglycerophosphate/cardiolipin synthase-like enzyme